MPDPMTLTDLRSRSKGASDFATLIDAVNAIRFAGRLPSSVSDTSVYGYSTMETLFYVAGLGAVAAALFNALGIW